MSMPESENVSVACHLDRHNKCLDAHEDSYFCRCVCHLPARLKAGSAYYEPEDQESLEEGAMMKIPVKTEKEQEVEPPLAWLIELNNTLHMMGHKHWLTSAKRAEYLAEAKANVGR